MITEAGKFLDSNSVMGLRSSGSDGYETSFRLWAVMGYQLMPHTLSGTRLEVKFGASRAWILGFLR